VLDGIRPGSALPFQVRPPSRKVGAISHIAVAGTERRAFIGLNPLVASLSSPVVGVHYRCSWRTERL
jgi:hypothetical protein